MDSMFLLFASIGFVAQLLDGSIGMGFGLISYTVLINCYLIGVGIIILWRAGQSNIPKASSLKTGLVGRAGGVLEALAGVWGPMVTSNLVAAGSNPRMVVGTVTVAEVFVAVVVFVILVGHLGFNELSTSALGLMAGALLAAPFAARLTKQLPRNVLMNAVGLLVIAASGYRLYRFF